MTAIIDFPELDERTRAVNWLASNFKVRFFRSGTSECNGYAKLRFLLTIGSGF